MQLFITTPGTLLKQREGMFVLTSGEKKKEIAPSRLSRIVMSSTAAVTARAVDARPGTQHRPGDPG